MSSFTSSSMYDVLPSALFERISTMKRIGKSSVKIQPLNNGSINSTQSITFQLPNDAILDLATLEFSALVKLPHNGAASGTPQNYYQGKYLPRNGLASLISSIDIQINGKSISNIVGYSYLYNLIKLAPCDVSLDDGPRLRMTHMAWCRIRCRRESNPTSPPEGRQLWVPLSAVQVKRANIGAIVCPYALTGS